MRISLAFGLTAAMLGTTWIATALRADALSDLKTTVETLKQKKQSQSRGGARRYSIASTDSGGSQSAFDQEWNNLMKLKDDLVACANKKASAAPALSATLTTVNDWMTTLNALKPIAAFNYGLATAGVQNLARSARTLLDNCNNLNIPGSSGGGAGSPSSSPDYNGVSAMMMQEFTQGDRSPTSRAVQHAAKVDMPAHGRNVDGLKSYLRSQNGVVKKWYCDNFGLQCNYDQVSKLMMQVFSSGERGPTSRAVVHATDVDMPARGGNPDALYQYLISQNGVVKKWYCDNFGLR